MSKKIRAILKTLFGSKVVEPNSAYLAVSRNMPQVGKSYNCYRLETNNKILREINTSPVREIKVLDENIFSVKTDNSYYITRIIGKPEKRTFFAFIDQYPHIGKTLECKKINFTSVILTLSDYETSSIVKSIVYQKGLYYIETLNSMYICIAMKKINLKI